jgi:hypothetical protein
MMPPAAPSNTQADKTINGQQGVRSRLKNAYAAAFLLHA